tara:strand:+ start:1892 stop:2905 length:1014 start_codon:yes stop_codon:yes gene_type:complete
MNKLKFAIFGTGYMAEIYAKLLLDNPLAELIGFVGNSSKTCKRVSEKFSLKVYDSGKFSDFLKDFDVDVVIIATPEWIRLDPIIAAVNSSKNIILEKPLADNIQDSIKIIDLFRDYKKVIKTCHVLRYNPRFNALFEYLKNNTIGEIRHISARRNSNNVRVKRVLGKTNLAFWLTPHDVDIIRRIASSEIESVYVQSRDNINSEDDYIIASLNFKNKISAKLEIFWCNPPLSSIAREFLFEVRGNKGLIEVNDFDNNINLFLENNYVSSKDTYEFYSIQNCHYGYFQIMINNFISDILKNKFDSKLIEELEQNALICEMISRSIKEKKLIYIDELNR